MAIIGDDLPTSGVYTTTRPTRGCRACRRGDHEKRFHELPATGIDHPDGIEEG